MNYDKFIIDFGQTADVLKFNLTSTDGKLLFREELDRGYLLDGQPWMNSLNHTPFGPYEWPNPEFSTIFSFGFCKIYAPGFLPKSVFWDPQLSALFDVGTPPAATPAAKKKSVPLGAILGSIFGVIGLVIIFVIIYVNSPKLQSVFQPFKTRHNVKDEQAISSRWRQARGNAEMTSGEPPASP